MFQWMFGIEDAPRSESSPGRYLVSVKDSVSGNIYFSLYQALVFSDVAPKEQAVEWAKQHIPGKWIVSIRTPETDEDLFLTKSGLFYVLCAGRSQEAVAFRDWVFECLVGNSVEGLH